MKKFTLDYTGDCFCDENFEIASLDGVDAPIFHFTEKTHYERSITYFVAYADKKRAITIDDNLTYVKTYLSDKNYILVEQGTYAFETALTLFMCTVEKSEEQYIIKIEEIHDRPIDANIMDGFYESCTSVADIFNERTYMKAVDLLKDRKYGFSNNAIVDKLFSNINNTGFLDITSPEDGNRYYCLDEDSTYNHRRSSAANSDMYLHSINKEVVGYLPNSINDLTISDIHSQNYLIVEKKQHNSQGTISQIENIYHDLNCLFWIKAKILYRFPQDFQDILMHYPEIYELFRRNSKKYSKAEEIEIMPDSFVIGRDKNIQLRCFKRGHYKAIERNLFQFVICKDFYVTELGKDQNSLRADEGSYACTLLDYDGVYYVVMYEYTRIVRHKNYWYADYKFHMLISLSDIMEYTSFTDKQHSGLKTKLSTLKDTVNYLLYRSKIEPVAIGEEIFSKMEVTSLSDLSSATCPVW